MGGRAVAGGLDDRVSATQTLAEPVDGGYQPFRLVCTIGRVDPHQHNAGNRPRLAKVDIQTGGESTLRFPCGCRRGVGSDRLLEPHVRPRQSIMCPQRLARVAGAEQPAPLELGDHTGGEIVEGAR